MNYQTLKKLSQNPHYRLSVAQQAELASQERKPMIEFGSLDKHDTTLNKHQTGELRVKRTSKTTYEKK